MPSMKMRDYAHTDPRSFKIALLNNREALARLDAEALAERGAPSSPRRLQGRPKKSLWDRITAQEAEQFRLASQYAVVVCVVSAAYSAGRLIGWL